MARAGRCIVLILDMACVPGAPTTLPSSRRSSTGHAVLPQQAVGVRASCMQRVLGPEDSLLLPAEVLQPDSQNTIRRCSIVVQVLYDLFQLRRSAA